MFCSNCGHEINADAFFCTNCGKSINNNNTAYTNDAQPEVETANTSQDDLLSIMKCLEKSLPIYKQISDFNEKEQYYRNNGLNPIVAVALGIAGLFAHIFITMTLWFIFTCTVSPAFGNTIRDILMKLCLISAVLLPLLVYMLKQIDNDKKIHKLQEAEQTYISNNICDEMFVLPEDYRYYTAINYIYRTLMDGRADSLKEALNLYVEQLDRWNHQQISMKIQREISAYFRLFPR